MPDAKSPPRSERELIVITRPDTTLRSMGTRIQSPSGAPVDPLNALLVARGVALRPLFAPSEDAAMDVMGAALAPMGPTVPEPEKFYIVEGAADGLDDLARDLRAQPLVEAAYVKPAAEPPWWQNVRLAPAAPAPGPTPNFIERQRYLDPAPFGVDARHAWTHPGGRGQGIHVVDLEWGWNLAHEDLPVNQGGLLAGTNHPDTDHGTAVIGVIGGDDNPFGITGIVPDAQSSEVAFSLPVATAIVTAAQRMSAGDVMLLEIHMPGPRFGFQNRQDQRGFIAVEWWPDIFAAIAFATAKGILVVEAAGNGGENLDDKLYDLPAAGFPPTWRNPFDRANPRCDAIVVGAGAPPPGTHGRTHGPDRSRLDFSNYGELIDAQAWGREVTTTGRSWGVADLYDGGPNAWYTDQFAGTSSASPIVAGVLASLQGIRRAKGKPFLTTAEVRALLRTTGSTQQDAPGRPANQRIGNRPDLRQIVPLL